MCFRTTFWSCWVSILPEVCETVDGEQKECEWNYINTFVFFIGDFIRQIAGLSQVVHVSVWTLHLKAKR
jgi:hypothetical protein